MKNRILTIGTSVMLLGTIASPALAQTVPTMNQPDNGFYEGPSPEWAVAHSTDTRGTETHRQYHRDAVRALGEWLDRNRPERSTLAYYNALRFVLQDRNMQHRQFHTAPLEPFGPTHSVGTAVMPTPPSNTTTPSTTVYSGERQSRRSIVAAAEEQNRVRAGGH